MFPQKLTLLGVIFIYHLNYVASNVLVHRSVTPGEVDEVKPTRTYLPPDACTCGADKHPKKKPWLIYIHIKNGDDPRPGRNTKVCVGTVLASNMIIASHQCLVTKSGIEPNENKDIRISTSQYPPNISNEKHDFTIRQIVLHTGDINTHNKDIALIFVNEMLTDNLQPICLPEYQPNLDVIHRNAYFYGLGGLLENDVTPERRRVTSIPIISGPECDKERSDVLNNNHAYNTTLCIRFPSPAPTLAGGPLIIGVEGDTGYVQNGTAYLVGLSSRTNREAVTSNYNYVYFSNVLEVITYIEQHGNEHGSKFCYPFRNTTFKIPKTTEIAKPGNYQFDKVVESKRPATLDCVCGITNSDPPRRISGGEEATPYEFGWMVKMLFSYDEKSYFGCGASIINDRVIVTAAHCLYKSEFGGYPKVFFLFLRKRRNHYESRQMRLKVKESFVHPQYIFQQAHDPKQLDADIGVVILEEPITFANGTNIRDFEDDIRPICLPKLGEHIETVGKQAIVVGWGLTEARNYESGSKYLQKLEQTILNITECIEKDLLSFTENLMCAGIFNKLQDAQQGDSGGPFILKEKEVWTLIGVVSRGDPGFDYDRYLAGNHTSFEVSIYTDVQVMLKFIDYHAEKVGAQWCKSKI